MLLQRVVQRDGDDRRSVETPGTPVGVLSWKDGERGEMHTAFLQSP